MLSKYTTSLQNIARLEINSSLSELAGMRKWVAQQLGGTTPIIRAQIVTTVDELCTNAILHGGQASNIQLEGRIDEGVAVFFICYKGVCFDPSTYASRPINDLVEAKQKGGIGLRMVNMFMDHLSCTCQDGNNIYQMTKKLV